MQGAGWDAGGEAVEAGCDGGEGLGGAGAVGGGAVAVALGDGDEFQGREADSRGKMEMEGFGRRVAAVGEYESDFAQVGVGLRVSDRSFEEAVAELRSDHGCCVGKHAPEGATVVGSEYCDIAAAVAASEDGTKGRIGIDIFDKLID